MSDDRPRWMSYANAHQPTFCGWCGGRHGPIKGGTCYGAGRPLEHSDTDELTGGAWRWDPFRRVQVWVRDKNGSKR